MLTVRPCRGSGGGGLFCFARGIPHFGTDPQCKEQGNTVPGA